MATATRLLLAAAVLVALAVILAPTPATSAEVEECLAAVPSECTNNIDLSRKNGFISNRERRRIVRSFQDKCCAALANNVEDRCLCEVASIVKKNAPLVFRGFNVAVPESACGKLRITAEKSNCAGL
jgi:hypothetical protein